MKSVQLTRVIVAYVTMFLLAKQLKLPMPNDLLVIFEHKISIAILLLGSAWAATQDLEASVTGLVLYGSSLVLFHKRNENTKSNFEQFYNNVNKQIKEEQTFNWDNEEN